MNDESLDELLNSANPAEKAAVDNLELSSAQDELMHGVLSSDERSSLPENRPHPFWKRWRLPALGIAAATVCAVAVLLIGGSESDPTSPGSAWAAEQVRFAEASPLVLLDLPGWKVGYANEETEDYGEMDFIPPGTSHDPFALEETTLYWREGPLSNWVEDRGSDPTVRQFTARVLDTTARAFDTEEDGVHYMRALWQQGERVLEFSSVVPDRQAFEEQLGALIKVDVDQWLSALPKSSVPVADGSLVAEGMLRGIPLPPGFDPADIKVEKLTQDRYQLGIAVLSTVVCSWLDGWATARSDGAQAKAQEAEEAMSTSSDWPLVREMERSGAYQHIATMVATAMRENRLDGDEISKKAGLGCSGFGIDLKPR